MRPYNYVKNHNLVLILLEVTFFTLSGSTVTDQVPYTETGFESCWKKSIIYWYDIIEYIVG